jgi:hypothetical protein
VRVTFKEFAIGKSGEDNSLVSGRLRLHEMNWRDFS